MVNKMQKKGQGELSRFTLGLLIMAAIIMVLIFIWLGLKFGPALLGSIKRLSGLG